MTCQEIEELSGAYALDALTPEEKAEVDKHLANCPECVKMVRELQAVVNLLPLSVPDAEPAADLQERFFNRLRMETGSTPSEHEEQISPTPIPITQRRARKRWQVGALIAAAVLLFTLVGSVIAWNISVGQVGPTTAYQLQATGSGSNVHGQMTCYSKDNVCVLVVNGLARTSDTQVYQGWLLRGKQPVSIGLLKVQNGTGTLSFPGNLSGYDGTAISLEPGPQASPNSPQGPVIATAKI